MRPLPADLRVVRHGRARRIKLRLDSVDGAPVLVLPPGVSRRSGEAFVRQNLDWLAERRAARPAALPFRDGLEIPFQDDRLAIVHRADGRFGVRRNGAMLEVAGGGEHLNRRVTDWLKAEARRRLAAASRSYADEIGVRIARLRIADQKSRWGSCSARAVLSFNWRLVLAPAAVLDFVAAHETAHLKEMNHGSRFHALVARLHPDPEGADAWLKAHGASLRIWGRAE
ncbi:M48 family metallopeptidase [Minwuia thermotolerans]|uniref:M48 family peptidase n=1 Tax=Minwuia thermotolerans TaxID=2056226 RepID=A0A2M9G6C9_9PROT|nr:SprT family zinc-dependent metalloprotease [Minwuia thermotolerans]PJK31261.1 M48 family peptidase [Minwuia thermotolerans]